jgi:2-hydroxychromene-2-carboxylate isomerase
MVGTLVETRLTIRICPVKQIEFYFDFGSPYTYIAYHALPEIAKRHGAEIIWRPILLGGVFKATGNASPMTIPLKGSHMEIDLKRWARHFNILYQMNPYFPINTLALMRGATGFQMADLDAFNRYVAAVFKAMFETPRNLNDPDEIGALLTDAGFDAPSFLKMIGDEAVKEKLKTDTAEAVARGIFGAPTFFVGDEMFWGQDRLAFVEQALG